MCDKKVLLQTNTKIFGMFEWPLLRLLILLFLILNGY